MFQRAFHRSEYHRASDLDNFLWKRHQCPLLRHFYVFVLLNGFGNTFFHRFLPKETDVIFSHGTLATATVISFSNVGKFRSQNGCWPNSFIIFIIYIFLRCFKLGENSEGRKDKPLWKEKEEVVSGRCGTSSYYLRTSCRTPLLWNDKSKKLFKSIIPDNRHGTKNWICCTFDLWSKLKSNLELVLTLPLTHVKRTVKSITNLLMPLPMVKGKSNL